jgi:hypothetical protein
MAPAYSVSHSIIELKAKHRAEIHVAAHPNRLRSASRASNERVGGKNPAPSDPQRPRCHSALCAELFLCAVR